MNIFPFSIIVFLILVNSSKSFCAAKKIVPIHDLPKLAKGYLGQSITAHGCLVTNRHGNFIHPCGSKHWHDATPVIESKTKLVSATYQKLGVMMYSKEIEADFSGVIVERDITWPRTTKILFLDLVSIRKARVSEL